MLEAEGYTLVNLRTGYEKRVGKWTLSPFFGVQNLLAQSYSGNVRINANGGRYFEPAPGGTCMVYFSWHHFASSLDIRTYVTVCEL